MILKKDQLEETPFILKISIYKLHVKYKSRAWVCICGNMTDARYCLIDNVFPQNVWLDMHGGLI
jgi:hypothetical protein